MLQAAVIEKFLPAQLSEAEVEALVAKIIADNDASGMAAMGKVMGLASAELAGKAAIRKELTEDSNREQSGAGLDTCTPAEYALLNQLNESYKAKFGFPFILAVKGHNRQSVIKHFAERLDNDYAVEFSTCLMQIDKIAEFRLQNVIE